MRNVIKTGEDTVFAFLCSGDLPTNIPYNSGMRTQNNAPLYEAIEKHIQRKPIPFHVPGHGMGTTFDFQGMERLKSVLPMDLTEISGLDDLHHPVEAIHHAQQLASECFHSDETFFLVNGSTVGNIAMIMAVCDPGDEIILPRNVHKSVLHGCLLGRVRPIYLTPRFDEHVQVATTPSVEDIEQALKQYPGAKAVFLTNPNYYGMGMDLAKVSELVHRYGIPLLVDEAHGAHYGFHDAYPKSAMQQNCDAAVQSTHKMLTALTMGSMLHIRGTRINRQKIKQLLGILQSSSPSYLILSSLDLARRYVWENGRERLEQVRGWTSRFAQNINQHSRLFTVPAHSIHSISFETLDPCKITIHSNHPELSGYKLKSWLEEKNIFVEMADLTNVLCVCSVGAEEERLEILSHALEQIENDFFEYFQKKQEQPTQIANIPLPHLITKANLAIDQVMDSLHEAVLLNDAIGHISAELVIPYPPGIPILSWGEVITEEIVEYLILLKREGASFQGVSDPSCETLKVVSKKQRPEGD